MNKAKQSALSAKTNYEELKNEVKRLKANNKRHCQDKTRLQKQINALLTPK